jgi:hypothetical protein
MTPLRELEKSALNETVSESVYNEGLYNIFNYFGVANDNKCLTRDRLR